MFLDSVTMLEGSRVTNLTVTSGTSFPDLPELGEIFFRTDVDDGVLYVYNSLGWTKIGSSSGASASSPVYELKDVQGNYTLTNTDFSANTMVRVEAPTGTQSVVTVPNSTSVSTPIGTTIFISSNGYGTVTITGELGVTIGSPQSLTIDRKFGRILLVKTGDNTWEIDGQLVEQIQFYVLTISPTHYSRITDFKNQAPPSGTSAVITQISPSSTYISASQYSAVNYDDYTWNSGSTSGSSIFGPVAPHQKYLRASITAGNETLEDGSASAYFKYYPAGVWAQYISNGTTQQDYDNPRWKISQQFDNQIPCTLTIDISDSPSVDDIIGSFTFTVNPIKWSNFIQNFSVSSNKQYFYMNTLGDVFESSTNSAIYGNIYVNAGTYNPVNRISSATTNPDLEFDDGNNIVVFYRVTALSGVTSHSGTGQLGVQYTPTTMKSVTFGADVNTAQSVFKIEVLSNVSGTIQQVCYGNITLNAPGGVWTENTGGGGTTGDEGFDNAIELTLNEWTNTYTIENVDDIFYFKYNLTSSSQLDFSFWNDVNNGNDDIVIKGYASGDIVTPIFSQSGNQIYYVTSILPADLYYFTVETVDGTGLGDFNFWFGTP